ncbi:MAG TPA: winged helix-turn-helix domain-containing protein [Pseudomonas sp.]|nr:winged helix-turn-helix domain-containing protein [Pseudomonas sp.]
MLEPLLGSTSKERVLIYLYARDRGYASEIAEAFSTGVTPIQNQLEALEAAGIIWCEPQGRTKVYALNPRYPFLAELKALLARAFEFYPPEDQEWLRDSRRRPRRSGKPLTL